MPYANNQGIRIHYEVEGEGPPLVLQHGLTDSLEGWRDIGYVEALKDDYRLVLIDARGHGASDKPHDPDSYRWQLMVSDVVEVLDDMGIERAHYWGYSMGAIIGWWAAIFAPRRFDSLTLGGDPPFGEVDSPGSWEDIAQAREWVESILRAPWNWEAAFPAYFDRRRRNDVEALAAYRLRNMTSRRRVRHPNALMEVLPWLEMPCPALVYVGGVEIEELGVDENYLNCLKNMPNVTFAQLPGLDHLDGWFRIDLVLPHVREFLAGLAED